MASWRSSSRCALPGGAPKYRNSRNDLLYQKSQLLFGLDRARETINRSRQAVLVEGQFDVIRLAQAGISNVLAVSGSNLTAAVGPELTA